MGNWGAENANDNHSRKVDRERQQQADKRQARAASAAGRGKRQV